MLSAHSPAKPPTDRLRSDPAPPVAGNAGSAEESGANGGEILIPPVTARVWTLGNGLAVIVQEDRSAPVASVQAWCETGSIHEGKHLGAGLSHILEHMLFKGTPAHPSGEFVLKVQDQGGYINAYTSYDRTVYWVDIPSKGVAACLDLLADAVMNSSLPPEEYTKEQEVIRREFAMGYDDPDRVAGLQLMAAAFQAHPYRNPVIGHLDVFNQLTRDDVMEYHKLRYVPNNMFFVVVGDVDAHEIHGQLERFFEPFPRRALPPVYIPREPVQLGFRRRDTEFPTELTRLNFAWHIPALTSPDIPALDLLSSILGDGRSSRLYRKVREELGLVNAIGAYTYAPGDPGLLGIDANLDPGNREAAENAIREAVEEMKAHGITPAELEKAKRRGVSAHLSALTTMRGKAGNLGSDWLLARNLNFSNEMLAALQRVTAADVRRVANEYLRDDNLTVSSLNPPGALEQPAGAKAVPAAGEIQKFTLPNGLRLLVREDPTLPLVAMDAVFKAGLLAETPETNGITKLLARSILKGTATRTAAQIGAGIESAGGAISTDAGNNSMSVAVRALKPDTAGALELLADVLLNPIFPEAEIAREKQLQLAGIKAEEEEATVAARHLMRATLFPGHPYSLRGNGSPETVGNLTRAQLVDFHKKHAVAKNCVLAVFGDVKAAEIEARVRRLFAAMPTGEEALTQPPQPAPFAASQNVEEYRNKAQAILMVGFRGTDMFSPDRPVLELIDEASSDLGSRFFERIREKMGLAYFVGSTQLVGLVPGPFVFYLGTSPEKLEEVKAEMLDEIRNLAANGLTEAELERAKQKAIGSQAIRNQSGEALAYSAALDELYGMGFDYYKKENALYEAVTLGRVKQVAQKYFDNRPAVVAVVRPNPA